MFCSKCGSENTSGNKFCIKCGNLIENNNIQSENSTNVEISNNVNQNSEQVSESNQVNNNVEKVVNPDMNKFAVLSVVVGAVGIICSIFIGMSLLLSVLLSSLGFSFAQKGKVANKTLSIVGYVLNGLVLAYGILIFILVLLGIL